jgi:hypothetical protein
VIGGLLFSPTHRENTRQLLESGGLFVPALEFKHHPFDVLVLGVRLEHL